MKEGLIAQLQTVRQFFLNSTRCLEEKDSNFAPKDEMFTVAQQVEHAAQSIEWFMEGAFGEKGFDMNFEQHLEAITQSTSLEKAMKRFNGAIDSAIYTLQQVSDEELMTPISADSPIMPNVPKVAVISGIEDHTAHHRGALTVYSRLLGKVPPMPYQE